MPTAISTFKRPRRQPAPAPKRWTRREYAFLVQNDLLPERHELINGEILSKRGQNRPHIISIMLLTQWLLRVFGEDFVQTQGPIDVVGAENDLNEPEPDVAVLAHPITHYEESNPSPADLLLVGEVADTTLAFDLHNKSLLYARAGIREYWGLAVKRRTLFIHRDPTAAGYREINEFQETEIVATLTRPDAAVRVADLLPPR